MKIQGRVSLHDKYQIEMKFTCPVDRARRVNNYHIDVFFFLPRTLSVTGATYTKERFYRDLTEYIRLKTPEVDLAVLAAGNGPAFERLSASFQDLKDGVPDAEIKCTEQLKLFCSIVRVALRDGAARTSERSIDVRNWAIPEYLRNTEKVLTHFRSMRSALVGDDSEIPDLFNLVDEFLSVTANSYKYLLWKQLDTDGPANKALVSALAQSTKAEIDYRVARKYPSVPEPGKDNAELLYRESAMKKTMASVLYLKVAVREAGLLLENIFLSVGAAVAMIFVTGIAFLWKGLFLEEFSLSFFVVWVIAYMFKDRIKALLQSFFASHKSTYSFDYNQRISDSMNREVGVCRESVCFRKESEVDPRIRILRGRSALSRHVNGPESEDILLFRKRIELFSKPCEGVYKAFLVEGVDDIVRFNVREWLRKMDNPTREIYCPGKDGSLETLKAKRFYHVNMLIRYGGNDGQEEYVRYRLILTRNGIREIQTVK